MKFKAKLRKIGNSQGVYIPKNVITSFKIGEVIELEVITSSSKNQEKPQKVITSDKKNPNVITSKPHKRLEFNVKTGLEEWV